MKNHLQEFRAEIDRLIKTSLAMHRLMPSISSRPYNIDLKKLTGVQRLSAKLLKEAKEYLEQLKFIDVRYSHGRMYFTIDLDTCVFDINQAKLYAANFSYECPYEVNPDIHQQVEAEIDKALNAVTRDPASTKHAFRMKVPNTKFEQQLRAYLADRRIKFQPVHDTTLDFMVGITLSETLLTYEQRQRYMLNCVEAKKMARSVSLAR